MKIIPRRVLFSDPEKSLPKISGNGKLLAFLAPWQENLNVWVAPIDSLEKAWPLSQSTQPIKDFYWSANSDYIIYFHDHQGDENWQLTTYHILTKKTQSFAEKNCQTKIIQISVTQPEKILIALNKRDKHYYDIYELTLGENTLHCIYENHQYWDFIADNDLNLRFGIKVNKHHGQYWDLLNDNATDCVAQINQHDMFHMYFYPKLKAKITNDLKTLIYLQSIQDNTTQLTALDLRTNTAKQLGGDEKADIFDILYCPQTGQPIAYSSYFTHKKWVAINNDYQKDFHYLASIGEGELDILSQTQDNQEWVVSYHHDNKATDYYHYDRTHKRIKKLFVSHPEFQNYTFSKMVAKVIPMRDGLECVSYLSLPATSTKGPVPLVLKVHGGPNIRDCWGYNGVHQWLANRGYAVLSVNYRASTGFGKQHSLAGNKEWGNKIPQDLLDAVSWALKEKMTTPDKIAIMGQSFGGYQVLLALTQSSDVFCCGVDIVGFADVEKTLKQFPPYWKPLLELIYDAVGASPSDPDKKTFLEKISPIHNVSNIKKPLLIAHGENDARIMQSESEMMVKALQINQIPVTYAVFADEGHTISHPGNKMAFYALVEAFLAINMGGKTEPNDLDVHTSMQVKVDDFKLLNLL